MSAQKSAASRLRRLTISLLAPFLSHPRASQIIKYVVYGALVVNFAAYIADDVQAHLASLSSDSPWSDVLTRYSTSIDTLAWIGLVALLELETYALPDEAHRKPVLYTLHGTRFACYLLIAYAAYGYTVETLDNYDVSPIPGLSDVCEIAGEGRYLQLDAIEYVEVTAANCADLSDGDRFFRISDDSSVIAERTLGHVQWIGWFDVANAFVWLLVVFLIEIEVRLQTWDQFSSRWLTVVRVAKAVLYVDLIAHGIVWAVTGYALYTWDAFLWIFGFWAIELNLAEWERDRILELEAERSANVPLSAR